MKKPKLNVRLLRKIQRHILEEPRRFFMTTLIATGVPGRKFPKETDWISDLPTRVPPCGTAACIAGWTLLLNGYSHKSVAKRFGTEEAQSILGLENDTLFFASEWPEPFQSSYMNAKTPKTRAKIAVARIEYLIKEGK